MGETRDTERGSWTVFEGDEYKTDKTIAAPWDGVSHVNDPIEWPITLRVGRIRDGVMESVDVEVDEQLHVTVKADKLNVRDDRALEGIAEVLNASEWHGADDLETIAMLMRKTGRLVD